MILYLTSEAKNEYLDFINTLSDKELTEKRLPITKLKKLYIGGSLQNFISQDFRNYINCEYLVIDINVFSKEPYEDILSAIKSISYMSSARVILILSGYEHKNRIQVMLLQNGIKNLVTAEERSKIIAELESSLTPEGLLTFVKKESESVDYDKTKITDEHFKGVKNEFIFKNTDCVTIAFMGVGNCSGTTTNALNLANFLSSIGARVCYIENNDSGSINFYKKILMEETISNSVKIGDVDCFINNPKDIIFDDKDFIVYDCGKVVSDQFIKADLKIVCCSISVNEIKDLFKFTQQCHLDNLIYLSHSVQDDVYEVLGDTLGIDVINIKHSVDYADYKNNQDIFLRLIEPYCEKKRTL